MIPARPSGRAAKRAPSGQQRKCAKVYLLEPEYARATARAAALGSSLSLYIEGLVVRDLADRTGNRPRA